MIDWTVPGTIGNPYFMMMTWQMAILKTLMEAKYND